MPDRRSPGIGHAENVPGRPKLPEGLSGNSSCFFLGSWSTQKSASQPKSSSSRWPRPLSQTRPLLWKRKLLWRVPSLFQQGERTVRSYSDESNMMWRCRYCCETPPNWQQKRLSQQPLQRKHSIGSRRRHTPADMSAAASDLRAFAR